ncbi:hypothetical protein [Sphingomonas sp. Leaf37]|uniref:hypothetical protein n=1 Tax=Sphingomonas sp. Leaf37 TaxID=2876552 RepID=UPI001E46C2ED|nr:hypothetical protein [Sphingomonas sp. Leaf37]
MPVRPPTFRPRGRTHGADARREVDRQRGSASARGYDADWQRAAKAHLIAHPLCRYCEVGAWDGRPMVTAATLVDHYHPHRGDRAVFWAAEWWVSSCKACHDGPKQRLERSGRGDMAALARRLGLPVRT